MRWAAVLAAATLLPLVPVEAYHGPEPAPPVELRSFRFAYAYEPHDGSGQNFLPWTDHTYVWVDVTNPTREDLRNVTAIVYSGAQVGATERPGVVTKFQLVFPLLPKESTLTYFFDKNTLRLPYWCISLEHPTDVPPHYLDDGGLHTGFDTGECAFPESYGVPPPLP